MGVAILLGDWRRRKEKGMEVSEVGGQWETQPDSEMVPAYCMGSALIAEHALSGVWASAVVAPRL